MKTINYADIDLDNSSYVDPHGRVFKMDNRIFRAISLSKTDFFIKLLNEGFFKQLVRDNKLVETELTDYVLEGFGIILAHRKIEFINYCYEWSPEMLKDAALLMLDICIELSKHNLTLQDAYPWNISFEKGKPIFIDIGSITEVNKYMIWDAYNQFCNFFLFPLYLYSCGFFDIIRPALSDYLNGISEEMFLKLLPLHYRLTHPGVLLRTCIPVSLGNISQRLNLDKKIYNTCKEMSSKAALYKVRTAFFRNLYREVNSINFPSKKSHWSGYYKNFDCFLPSSGWNEKQKSIYKSLNELKPKTVLDIGCNKGWYSILASRAGSEVISFDVDQLCISGLYDYVKREGQTVTPLIMNALDPSPDSGWRLRQFPSAIKRFRSEMVFSFAVMHHMIFGQWQNFERIVGLLNDFSEKWLFIEFVPKEDELAKTLLLNKPDNFAWYTYDNLILELKKYYKNIKVFDSSPQGRKLLLCEK